MFVSFKPHRSEGLPRARTTAMQLMDSVISYSNVCGTAPLNYGTTTARLTLLALGMIMDQ